MVDFWMLFIAWEGIIQVDGGKLITAPCQPCMVFHPDEAGFDGVVNLAVDFRPTSFNSVVLCEKSEKRSNALYAYSYS